jgi:hypothetical protein
VDLPQAVALGHRQQREPQSLGLLDKRHQPRFLLGRRQILVGQHQFQGFAFAAVDQRRQLRPNLLRESQLGRDLAIDGQGQIPDKGRVGGQGPRRRSGWSDQSSQEDQNQQQRFCGLCCRHGSTLC